MLKNVLLLIVYAPRHSQHHLFIFNLISLKAASGKYYRIDVIFST